MLEFFTVGVSVVLALLTPPLETDNNFLVTAFSYGSVKEQFKINLDNQPLATELLFTGDIMLARNVEKLMEDYGQDYPFSGIKSITQGAGFTIGNFEAAVPKKHISTLNSTLRFSVKESFLTQLQLAGFDYLSLANNHSYDYGSEGLKSTRQFFQAYDLVDFGGPGQLTERSVSYLSLKDGRTLALVGLTTLNNNHYTKAQITALFEAINKQSDIQIVYIHWGEEYQSYHSNKQERMARFLITAGADAIIGHHPHVVQDIQVYHGVPVFYSLGNFIFDQYFSTAVQEGLLLKLSLTELNIDYELIPIISIGSRSRPYIMAPYERHKFLTDLASRSNPKLKTQIHSGQLQF